MACKLHIICVFILCFVKWTHAVPTILTLPDTIRATSGDTVVLRCQVKDLGQNKVVWTFMSKDFIIYEGNRMMTNDVIKYSLINAADGFVYNLQILYLDKPDQGFYSCSINGTDQKIIHKLDVLDMPDTPSVDGLTMNVTDCCIANRVSQTCLPACNPGPINLDDFTALTNCRSLTDLAGLSTCFTKGSNHDHCCLSNDVDPICLDFCHNSIPSDLSLVHAAKCYTDKAINGIFNCFELGSTSLPSEPTGVSALAMHDGKTGSIMVKWSAPLRNPNKVTGYIIKYRPRTKSTYSTVVLSDPSLTQYRLDRSIISNMDYKIHVVAQASHGISMPSVEVDIYIPDSSVSASVDSDMYVCCMDHNVPYACSNVLCRSKIWAKFDVGSILGCFEHVDDIFKCLAGARNQTNCCVAFGVTSECLSMCSGEPPAFDQSLVGCISQTGIIEACVQQGHATLPPPPSQLELSSVSSSNAVLRFQPSRSPGMVRYVVELRQGDESKPFIYYGDLDVNATTVTLTNLQPNTYYWVWILAENALGSSLPSEIVAFLTYPDLSKLPVPDPITNIPHNLTECCMKTGMPQICWEGCIYTPGMTAYYKPIISTCYAHIGTVLACAADGRDHTDCCLGQDMLPVCLDLCVHTKQGPLDPKYIACLADTAKAVMCHMEGISHLPRHPDVVVSNVSKTSISLKWTQPDTSGLIDKYIVFYGPEKQLRVNDTTNRTSYIMQNLLPGTAYEISVMSANENGTSAMSPVIRQYTLKKDVVVPSYNKSSLTGRALWQNITHCCSSTVSAGCQDECLNKQTAVVNSDTCKSEVHKMLTCFADGQDHRQCCVEKGLPESCNSLCGGLVQEMDISMASCMSYGHLDTILSCFIENKDLIPGPPAMFGISQPSKSAVELTWSASSYCETDCSYIIHYWKNSNMSAVTDIKNATSPYTVANLAPGTRYTFTVAARNRYGSGPPSPWQTVYISHYDLDVKIFLRSPHMWVEQGQNATLQCSVVGFNPAIPYNVTWMFKSRRLLQAGKDLMVLALPNVNSKDEGEYTCTVTDKTVSSSDTIYLPIKYTPKLDQLRDKSAPPNKNEQAKVACWFRGYPDSSEEAWLKDGNPIQRNLTKYSMARDPRYDTGITSYRIKIADVVESDYGTYSIRVSNSYGFQECHVLLANPLNIPPLNSTTKETDVRKCCVKEGVSDLCLQICSFNVDLRNVIADSSLISCLQYFETFLKCAADGRDHTKCCEKSGVLPFCDPFCRGESPGDVIVHQDKLLQCMAESETIFQCIQEGHKTLPLAPENVQITMENDWKTLLVAWSPSKYNSDKIEHYNVYYSYSGNPHPYNISVNVQKTELRIFPVFPGRIYKVWITAANRNGESFPSAFKSITAPFDGPYDVKATPIENTADVSLTWTIEHQIQYISYTIFYREKNTARFYSISGVKTLSYRLTGLKENTYYTVYVIGNGIMKNTSESDHIDVLTGHSMGGQAGRQSDSKDHDRDVAIGVGVTVGIIALAAMVFLVAYFVCRARTHSGKIDDTVAFENPGFGTPGSVKIHGVDDQFNYGRLDEDNEGQHTYDNPSTGVSQPGSAFDNMVYQSQPANDTATAAPPTLHVDAHS